jgi:hypothetical protein
VKAFDKAGWQVHTHAIGDRAVRTALDAFGAARKANGHKGNRHTIAHLQLVDPADYGRFAQLGVIADMQMQWACDDYWTGPALFIGEERHSRLYPAGSLLDAGARLAGGSDWPVDPLYPWNQVETAVDRIGLGGLPETGAGGTGLPLDPDQAIGLSDSLTMHTQSSAYQLHQDHETGSLQEGKRADIQVLDRDVTSVPLSEIALSQVLFTTVGGVPTFDATAAGAKATANRMDRVRAAAAAASKASKGLGCACHER